jgi:hypothetical protein
MAIAEELQSFVKDSLSRGLPRAEIERVLQHAGWPPDHVRTALRGFAEVEFAVPVPVPKPYLSAREAFLHLVLFSTLYVSAFNLGALVFQLINLAFPDPAAPAAAVEIVRDAIRWSISYLVVAFPVFLYVARLTGRETRRDPSKRASKVRRWLTYLTLFVAAAVLIGDIIGLVYSLLGGELTVRFILKVSTIAVIAGTVFGHYLRDLRIEEKGGPA